MAEPRASSLRGSVVRDSGPRIYRPGPSVAEDVIDPTRPRRVVLHTLQRRATLRAVYRGAAFTGFDDVTDNLQADTYLLRAARHHGEPSERPCPICRRTRLVHLHYTFSDEFPAGTDGRLRHSSDLPTLAQGFGAFTVFLVEVCPTCSWNHLVMSYVLGDGKPRARRNPKEG